jgi:tetratricopeptide (TPR) repeat protein
LLFKNPVFQPANLALRNAWFSGGVEWNIGMTGHTPFTVSPVFCAEAVFPDGTPVLRMYEWERIRRVSYRIDAYLPEDSKFLFINIKICNTRNMETPIYWWSNIAVPEAADVRVIAPAETAYWFDYQRIINKRPVPELDGIDRSYTTRVPHSMDTFFDLDPGRRKWITAVNGDGYGLIQTSTDRLLGRKLFMWGNGSGGRHWQEFLSEPGTGGYLEIQAGLAKTQMQHIPMPAMAQWEWLEAYGAIKVDPKKAHGPWTAAYEAVEKILESILPRAAMEVESERPVSGHKKTAGSNGKNAEGGDAHGVFKTISFGSGWAALEKARITAAGGDFEAGDLSFDDASMDGEQAPWLDLLRLGDFPERDPDEYPAAYLVQEEWRVMLEESLRLGKSNNWHAYLQLGVMHYAAGNIKDAVSAFEKSVGLTPSAWAYRNLSSLYGLVGVQKSRDLALEFMEKAANLSPVLPVALEYARLLLKEGLYDRLAAFTDGCLPEIRNNWRMLIMRAQAAVQLDQFDAALAVLNSDMTVCDIREGEVLLSDIWIQLHKRMLVKNENAADDDMLEQRVLERYPLPKKLDFRMRT